MPLTARTARVNWEYYVKTANKSGDCLNHWVKPRWIWEGFHKKVVPVGIEVCHTCDNPGCINIDHMWEGTHQDNMADAVNKGRHPGSRNLVSARKVAHVNAGKRAEAQWAPGGSLYHLRRQK